MVLTLCLAEMIGVVAWRRGGDLIDAVNPLCIAKVEQNRPVEHEHRAAHASDDVRGEGPLLLHQSVRDQHENRAHQGNEADNLQELASKQRANQTGSRSWNINVVAYSLDAVEISRGVEVRAWSAWDAAYPHTVLDWQPSGILNQRSWALEVSRHLIVKGEGGAIRGGEALANWDIGRFPRLVQQRGALVNHGGTSRIADVHRSICVEKSVL